jgi:hypothetical protein
MTNLAVSETLTPVISAPPGLGLTTMGAIQRIARNGVPSNSQVGP